VARGPHRAAGLGASSLAKSYRLLHAIFQTAVEDDLVVKNPCILRGASVERPAERPIATVAQVFELVDEIEDSLLATFTGLRLGEIRALRRDRIDLLHKRVMVQQRAPATFKSRTLLDQSSGALRP
jgi:integrase